MVVSIEKLPQLSDFIFRSCIHKLISVGVSGIHKFGPISRYSIHMVFSLLQIQIDKFSLSMYSIVQQSVKGINIYLDRTLSYIHGFLGGCRPPHGLRLRPSTSLRCAQGYAQPDVGRNLTLGRSLTLLPPSSRAQGCDSRPKSRDKTLHLTPYTASFSSLTQ
jgi:hypothetical protein